MAWVSADLGDRASLENGAQEAATRFGKPDILVNCAGINLRPPMNALTMADWDQTIAVNLTASRSCSASVFGLLAMADRSWERIISVASQIIRPSGRSGNSAGGTARPRAGLASLTRSQSEAWAPRGVCCNAISPGFVITPLTREAAQHERRLPGHEAEAVQRAPVGPEQVGEALLGVRPDPVRADYRFISHVANNKPMC